MPDFALNVGMNLKPISMEKYQGIIWIRNITSGSKSDGNKTYFIDNEFNHFQLYRKGEYEINDEFFYPFHLKTVVVTGEIQKNKWIMVETIELLEDNFLHIEEVNELN